MILLSAAVGHLENSSSGGETLAYIGTYTGAKSKGIYSTRLDPKTGALSSPELAAETRNPSFLAVHPNGRWLYAIGEISDFGGKKAGAVSAFQIDRTTGRLKLINEQASGGTGPAHLALDPDGRCLLVANYGSGSVAALPIQKNGGLAPASSEIQHHGSSVNPKRQAGPHAHHITTDPASRFALVCDLGLDRVLTYQFAPARGILSSNDPPSVAVKPGAGPRHLAFRPDGRFVYVINELDSSVTVFAYDPRRGSLSEVQTVPTVPADFGAETTCAEVQVHPSGKFVYGSNRGHDSIVVFAADHRTGRLTLVEHESTQGKTPRHFALDPSGRWLMAENQGSDTIAVFKVDQKTGALAPAGHRVEVGSPVCLVFVP